MKEIKADLTPCRYPDFKEHSLHAGQLAHTFLNSDIVLMNPRTITFEKSECP